MLANEFVMNTAQKCIKRLRMFKDILRLNTYDYADNLFEMIISFPPSAALSYFQP